MKFTLLIIDDEKNIREGLAANFEMDGYNVKLAENGKQGLEFLAKGDIDLVITDLRMPGISGEEVLRKVTTETPGVPVIVLTGHGSIDSAVDAMRNGAYDFLTKPLNLDQLSLIVKRALEARELSLQHKQLKNEVEKEHVLDNIIGKSAEMQKVFEMIKKVSASKASVLITGESGVGKEVVADAIHNLSPRKKHQCIKVHCAALSETLLESELFGHEKGAFTGADSLVKGRFELAHESSIFLDEIGEINQSVQIKILRVLQERAFERVGGQETINVDVRIIAATNRNLGIVKQTLGLKSTDETYSFLERQGGLSKEELDKVMAPLYNFQKNIDEAFEKKSGNTKDFAKMITPMIDEVQTLSKQLGLDKNADWVEVNNAMEQLKSASPDTLQTVVTTLGVGLAGSGIIAAVGHIPGMIIGALGALSSIGLAAWLGDKSVKENKELSKQIKELYSGMIAAMIEASKAKQSESK